MIQNYNDPLDTFNKKCVVYKISVSDCQSYYIRQTKRSRNAISSSKHFDSNHSRFDTMIFLDIDTM